MTPWDLEKNGQKTEFDPPFPSAFALLAHFAKTTGGKEAVIFDDFDNGNTISLTYLSLLNLVKQTADFLTKQLGVEKTFAYAFTNRPEIIVLNLAAMIAGKIFVPLDVKRDSLEQKAYKLKLANAKLLILPSAGQEEAQKLQNLLPKLQVVEIENFADFQKKIETFPAGALHNPKLEEDCLILFTSGTTSLPKGVRLTAKSLLANADSIAKWLEFNENDRFNILLPLHHINSTTFSLTTLLCGATIVLSPRYSKSNFWKTLANYFCTGASIVPTIAYDLLSETENFQIHKNKLKEVRRFQIGSAPVNPSIAKKFIDQYGIPLIQGYGQTETSLRSAGVPMDLPKDEYRKIIDLNSVGTELKWTNVTILKEDGTECAEEENGEICVRGPVITPGYLDNPNENKKAFAYNWFHSGDRGYFKMLFGKKYFFLTGRMAEIIKKGGVLISPTAIENDLPKTSTGKIIRTKIKEIFGQKLWENSHTVFSAADFDFKIISPEETELLKQATQINNLAWGKNMESSLDEFTSRAGNGILIGAVDHGGKLQGSISALKTTKEELEKYPSYQETTGNGTLKTHNRKGDILICVAISTPPAKTHEANSIVREKLTPEGFENYINSLKDYVIRFHSKPKGGFEKGAEVIKILPDFRPQDQDALGFNVLMKYPTLSQKPAINPDASTGTQLIEAALLYAYYQKIKDVYVLTSPAQASEYFEKST